MTSPDLSAPALFGAQKRPLSEAGSGRLDITHWGDGAAGSARQASRTVRIDPHLRGNVTPATLGRLAASGWSVHRVGHAAYLHRGSLRFLVGVWGRHEAPPAWADRLDVHHRWLIGRGEPTALEARRAAAWLERRRATRLRAPSGRYAGAVPWWASVDATGRLLTPRSEQPWRFA